MSEIAVITNIHICDSVLFYLFSFYCGSTRTMYVHVYTTNLYFGVYTILDTTETLGLSSSVFLVVISRIRFLSADSCDNISARISGTKRFDSEKAGDREVQRTMLELLNQLDGFHPSTDIKVFLHTCKLYLQLLRKFMQHCISVQQYTSL